MWQSVSVVNLHDPCYYVIIQHVHKIQDRQRALPVCLLSPPCAMQSAVGYIRTSSAANVGFGKDSDARQEASINDYAAAYGFTVIMCFADPAVPGTDPISSRPGFSKLIDHCLKESIKTIIFEDTSRFARDLIVQEQGFKFLTEQGFTLISASSPEAFLDEGPARTFIRQVLGAAAEFHKSDLVQRLQGARLRVASTKRLHTIAGAFQMSGRRSRIHGTDGPTIKHILKHHLQTKQLKAGAIKVLQAELADAGITTEDGMHVPERTVRSWLAGLRKTTRATNRRLRGKRPVPNNQPPHAAPALPQQIMDSICNVRQHSAWSKARAHYRECTSLYFGLGTQMNHYNSKASAAMPDLEAMLIDFMKPFGIAFTSILVNKYTQGCKMGKHSDDNAQGHCKQVIAIFGDYEGGDLVLYLGDGQQQVMRNGVHVFDATLEHEVLEVKDGVRYSVISYAKNIDAVPEGCIKSLEQRGFVMPH